MDLTIGVSCRFFAVGLRDHIEVFHHRQESQNAVTDIVGLDRCQHLVSMRLRTIETPMKERTEAAGQLPPCVLPTMK